jgi:hypothetical protein
MAENPKNYQPYRPPFHNKTLLGKRRKFIKGPIQPR